MKGFLRFVRHDVLLFLKQCAKAVGFGIILCIIAYIVSPFEDALEIISLAAINAVGGLLLILLIYLIYELINYLRIK